MIECITIMLYIVTHDEEKLAKFPLIESNENSEEQQSSSSGAGDST